MNTGRVRLFCLIGWIMALMIYSGCAPGRGGLKAGGVGESALRLGDPRSMTFSPLEFNPPKAERIELSNGLVLYLMEDRELPLIRIEALIRTGNIYEPADKIGLAGLTGLLLRTGGTRHWGGDEIDEELEFLAAGIETGIGADMGFASLDVLKKDFDRGLELFYEILRYPAMEAEKLDLGKKRVIEGILRRNDSPSSIAHREFMKLVYGADHPFGREASIATVTSITREDLQAFHQKYYHPNAMILGITGDFRREELLGALERTFGAWEPAEIDLPEVPAVIAINAPSVHYIERDLTQTHLRIGHLSIRQDNPDFFALSVLHDILGGRAFTSRMFQEIRTRRGLAYSVGTVLSPGNLDQGVFFTYAQTRAESTHEAISAIFGELRRIQEEPVTPQELEQAKQSFLNSYVFSFSSSAQIVNRQMRLEYYGFPPDFLERFRENVSRVTREDIQRVAEKYLHPDRLIVLAVGAAGRFERPLSSLGLGDVKTIVLEDERVDLEGLPRGLADQPS